MDILCNGSESERHKFSFRLMDIDNDSKLNFDEFYSYFSNVVTHWSSLINYHVQIDKAMLKQWFDKIDTKKKG